MNYFATWEDILTASLQNLWGQFITILPNIVGAIIILFLGLVVASLLGRVAFRLVRLSRIDTYTDDLPISVRLRQTGIRLSPSVIISKLVKWFFILVTFIAIANILGWTQINEFLYAIAFYIPNVLIAVLILVVGIYAARLVKGAILTVLAATQLTAQQTGFLGTAAQAAIIIFSVMASLVQLRIAPSLIQILFAGIVFALAIAFGLAFGLGGREKAARVLEENPLTKMHKR